MMQPKVLKYPIPGNPTGGILHIYGEPAPAQDIILYCGGFPDGVEPISDLAERLATRRDDGQDRGCYVGATCFPGFDYMSFSEQKFSGFKKSGFTFDEVTCCVRDAADLLFQEYSKAPSSSDKLTTTFTLMTHDWGAVIGHIFINRAIEERSFTQHKPDRLIMLDVLMSPHPKSNYREILEGIEVYKPTFRDNMLALSYRTAFAISFAALQLVTETIGLIVMAILTTIIFRILNLNPLLGVDDEHKECIKDLKHFLYMMYPYYHMFKELFKGSGHVFEAATLPADLKQTPVLYIYGAKKNVMFHDYRSVALLEKEEKEGLSKSRVVRLEESGHWMYCQQPEVCEDEIRKFLHSSGGASSVSKQSRL